MTKKGGRKVGFRQHLNGRNLRGRMRNHVRLRGWLRGQHSGWSRGTGRPRVRHVHIWAREHLILIHYHIMVYKLTFARCANLHVTCGIRIIPARKKLRVDMRVISPQDLT
jgi:hypothetical protein